MKKFIFVLTLLLSCEGLLLGQQVSLNDDGLSYDNPQNQIALNNGILHPAWYNYLLPGELILTGLINWLSLENYKD